MLHRPRDPPQPPSAHQPEAPARNNSAEGDQTGRGGVEEKARGSGAPRVCATGPGTAQRVPSRFPRPLHHRGPSREQAGILAALPGRVGKEAMQGPWGCGCPFASDCKHLLQEGPPTPRASPPGSSPPYICKGAAWLQHRAPAGVGGGQPFADDRKAQGRDPEAAAPPPPPPPSLLTSAQPIQTLHILKIDLLF